ncbi:MAG: RNA polymerase sigma factor SigM, partial [Pseudonocardiaceae bacterium]
MTAGSSDAELVAAHVAGDPRAFTELVQRYRDRMWSVAIRTLGDPEEAADALQDAFISAFRSIGSFRGQAQMTTWLHRIVVNACVDRIRKRQSYPTCPLPETGPDEPAVPRDAMADQETLLTVEAALDSLPVEQRVPIVLIDVEGYSVAEAAEQLGIAQGT